MARKPVAMARGGELGGTVVICDDGAVFRWKNSGICDLRQPYVATDHWEEICPIPGSKREDEILNP